MLGNVYVADQDNNKIRKIGSAGVVITFAGSGARGIDGRHRAQRPVSIIQKEVAVDASGNVYVADGYNNKIRKISSAGVVTTLAGSGEWGSTDGTGTAASFDVPKGVAVDASGNVYVADQDITNPEDRSAAKGASCDHLGGSGGRSPIRRRCRRRSSMRRRTRLALWSIPRRLGRC